MVSRAIPIVLLTLACARAWIPPPYGSKVTLADEREAWKRLRKGIPDSLARYYTRFTVTEERTAAAFACGGVVPDEILVMFHDTATTASREAALASVDARVTQAIELRSAKPWYVVWIQPTRTCGASQKAAARIQSHPAVRSAAPQVLMKVGDAG